MMSKSYDQLEEELRKMVSHTKEVIKIDEILLRLFKLVKPNGPIDKLLVVEKLTRFINMLVTLEDESEVVDTDDDYEEFDV